MASLGCDRHKSAHCWITRAIAATHPALGVKPPLETNKNTKGVATARGHNSAVGASQKGCMYIDLLSARLD